MDVPGFVLITGGASGIGRACAKAFALQGSAGVALLDVNEEGLAAVQAEIDEAVCGQGRGSGPGAACSVLVRRVDVTQEEQVQQAVGEVAAAFGRLDYVVNAAGIASHHAGRAASVDTENWQRVVDVNINGTMLVLGAAASIMLKQEPIASSIDGRPLQRGSIVNVASILGLVGLPFYTAYTATKHAVVGLTRSTAQDYAEAGLRINAICPGFIETPMTTSDPEIRKGMDRAIATRVPLRRAGQAQEVADGVLYLAGGRSSFVTGSTLVVDGGYTAG